jgi:diguanylate cyclase (GGDEF)-like protein/PAS domain S-box-containing protein
VRQVVRQWGRRLSLVLESVVSVPVVVLLHRLGYAGHAPLWICLAALLVGMVIQHPSAQRLLSGGGLQSRLRLRIALHVGLFSTVMVYLYGWGPLCTTAYLIPTLMQIRWAGAKAWRPAALWTAIGATVGQTGIALGLIYTYLPPAMAQISGISGAGVTLLLIRQYGLTAEERERAERLAILQDRRFGAMVANSSDIIAVLDRDSVITYISPSVQRLLGYRPQDLVGTHGAALMFPDDAATARRTVADQADTPGTPARFPLRAVHADGSLRWLDTTVIDLLDDPAIQGRVVNQRDITDQRQAQEQLEYDATHDLLTGLSNRRAFLQAFEAMLRDSRAEGRRLAVLYLDLDGFKQVNDVLGHDAGDHLLAQAAAALRGNLLGSDLVGRLGGDEFAVVLRHIDSADHAAAVARRLLEALSELQPFGDRHLRIAASIGIALSDGDPSDAPTLLHRADVAMYEAKRSGLGGWVVHDGAADRPNNRVSREDLLSAVARGQFHLQYQPVVEISSGRMLGVEALVRWRHPDRGMIPPSEFIPAAEETGAIAALGEWVAERACHQMAAWRRLGPATENFRLGINVSPRQLEASTTAPTLARIIADAGIPPSTVMLEVTESALVDSPSARQSLDAIAATGAQIAIDDFGTGYSSLQYLNRLPIHGLKLDRSFVAQLDGSAHNSAIAAAVAHLARTLGLGAVAEGIETPQQAHELAELGYEVAQGYLYARPVDADQITEWINAGTIQPAPAPPAAASHPTAAAATPTEPMLARLPQ